MSHLWFRTLFAAGVLTLAAAAVRAEPDDSALDLPPPANQPEDFDLTGAAIGSGFQISQRISPDTVQAGDPLTLTVQIKADKTRQAPRRPRLWELKPYRDLENKKLLKVERPDLRSKQWDQADRKVDDKTWEFDYQLRPLSETLTHLPELSFPYYTPSGTPGLPGRYQRTSSDEDVPLAVKARVEPKIVPETPIRAPAFLLDVAEGPAVRERREVFHLPSLPMLVLLLLLPPLTALGWYFAWHRLFPDALSRARHRQSRAAQTALLALRMQATTPPERVAAIAADYLHQRLGLPGAAPTPIEVAAWLERSGAPAILAGKAAEFFRACDAARFAPAPPGDNDLKAAASNLILTLEAESWSVRPS